MWSDNALARAEVSTSRATSNGTLLGSAVTTGERDENSWGHELFRHSLHERDSARRGEPDEETQTPDEWPAKPVNIAHRGGKCIAPENTLIGFREGLQAGADVLEMEVHLTADEQLVVMHDDTVDRTTNGSGFLRNMTLQEVKQLDAGYDYTSDGGHTYPYRGKGVVVPTLEEVYQEFPDVPFNVEIKDAQRGIEKALWQEIKEAKAADQTLVVSGKMRVTSRVREVSSGRVATGSSGLETFAFYLLSRVYLSELLSMVEPSYQALQVPEKLPEKYGGLQIVTPEFVQAAHQLGIRVDVWTINTEQDMRRVLGYGVDGIMTDRPDVLSRVLEEESKDGQGPLRAYMLSLIV